MAGGPGRSPISGDVHKKRVTLKVLAEHLSLSPATVSVVLNDAPVAASIPGETKERVFAAARELGYRPNHLARSLRHSRTYSVGVLVPEISEGYATGVMSGVEHHLIDEGYFYLMATHRSRSDLATENMKRLDDRLVEGFIVVAAEMDKAPALPMVAVAGHRRLEGVTNVVVNHDRAGELALSHLAELGHERIAFFKGHEHSTDTDDRWQGIVKAAAGLGLEVRPELTMQLAGDFPQGLFSAEDGYREGYAFAQKLLAAGGGAANLPFTALFAFDDISAIGAMRAFLDAGLAVPEDVSVIGFDDIQSAAFYDPSLTTVRQPLTEMGRIAARILLQRLAGAESFPDFVTVEPELVVRASTGPPKGRRRASRPSAPAAAAVPTRGLRRQARPDGRLRTPGRGEGKRRVAAGEKRVTLKAVAEHLNLSPSTVSVVLNRTPVADSIPRETKERIWAAARELDYRPNFVARSLRGKRSFTVGVLVPEMSEGYAAGLMSGVENHLSREGYFYLLASHQSKSPLVDEYVRHLKDRSVEGLILVAAPIVTPPGLPTVAVSGHREIEGVTNVVIDHDRAAVLALSHLAELGHDRVAFFKGPAHSADTEDRWQGIVKAAESLGLAVRPELTVELAGGTYSAEEGYREGYEYGRQLLACGARFTSLFAFNDIAAIGAMRALLDAGLSVPEDVSVVGFDDIQSAAFHNPSLTTVRQPLREMGELAGKILVERLSGDRPFEERVTVMPDLMVRRSTGPAPRRPKGRPARTGGPARAGAS